jgi:hypothetical protein
MYVRPNLKSKKALREAVARGEKIAVFSPGPFPAPTSGWTTVEGPHYPEPHRWYAQVRLELGYVAEVKA